MKWLCSVLLLQTWVTAQVPVLFPDDRTSIRAQTPPPVPTQPPPTETTSASIIPEECGIPGQPGRRGPHSRVRRISGGIEIKKGRWPWLAAIGLRTGSGFKLLCGGTLITRRHVLTAAQCFVQPKEFPYVVRLGEHNISKPYDANRQDFSIAKTVDGGYKQETQENDILIITLDGSVNFGEFIQPACLPFHERENDFRRRMLAVVGWGNTRFGERNFTAVPRETGVQIVDRNDCNSRYQALQTKVVIDERYLCAGTGGRDACGGDSGGPLNFLGPDGRYYVVGIVAFGAGCGHPDFPGVNTRVTRYLDWILNNLN